MFAQRGMAGPVPILFSLGAPYLLVGAAFGASFFVLGFVPKKHFSPVVRWFASVAFASAAFGFAAWCVAPTCPPDAEKRIKLGMSAEEVIAAVGKPDSGYPIPVGAKGYWNYALDWRGDENVMVDFSAEHRVVSVQHWMD